jgi:hypothetical protein
MVQVEICRHHTDGAEIQKKEADLEYKPISKFYLKSPMVLLPLQL